MYSENDDFPRRIGDVSAAGARASSLTYEPFYGLREKAFSLSADPRFLFKSPAHGPAFDNLLTGIRRREGLIVLSGEIGTGKTTLCRSVLQHLDRRTSAAFVADPFVSREDLLKTLLVDFGVISIGDLTRGRFDGASRSDLSYPLYEFLDSLVPLQAFAVLVIDEAQNLSLPLLEEIRILSELERREKLLQVVLVGQPELRSNLRLPQMRQVDQRVSVRCDLSPLDAEGVAGYVNHRLRVAAVAENRADFTKPALEAIYEGSAGVPRLINRICDRALQRGFDAGSLRIDAPFVWDAIDDLGLAAEAGSPQRALGAKPAVAPRQDSAAVPVPVPAATPLAVDAPAQPAPAVAPKIAVISPGLVEFASEADPAAAHAAAVEGTGKRRLWLARGIASSLALGASLAAVSWYSVASSADQTVPAALLPPGPAGVFAAPASAQPRSAAAILEGSTPTPTLGAPAAAPAPVGVGGYSIVVASFVNRDRAERLAQELTGAGYRARTIERDAGERGRFVQVTVGGYTSAIDVQRDLQNIRQLPGGYSDAQIVERE